MVIPIPMPSQELLLLFITENQLSQLFALVIVTCLVYNRIKWNVTYSLELLMFCLVNWISLLQFKITCLLRFPFIFMLITHNPGFLTNVEAHVCPFLGRRPEVWILRLFLLGLNLWQPNPSSKFDPRGLLLVGYTHKKVKLKRKILPI